MTKTTILSETFVKQSFLLIGTEACFNILRYKSPYTYALCDEPNNFLLYYFISKQQTNKLSAM